ncbi:MAG TPA: hypothetical protein VNA25_04775 [Phycisphaerae bacterium]|nr:hypothetical protein [Phycisphaerae bacterium]
MTEWVNILADGDIGNLTEILIVVVLIAIGIISSLVKKAMEKQAAKRQAPPEADQPHPTEQTQRQPRPTAQQRQPMGYEQPPARLPPAQMPPVRPQPARMPPAPTARVAVPPPVPAQAIGPQRHRAAQTVHRRQGRVARRHAAETLDMAQRGGGLAPAESPQPAHENAPGHAPAKTLESLDTPEDLRRALIYHEILSPPKALRDRPEMWDM